MARRIGTPKGTIGKRVAIDCYAMINPGEVRIGRSVETKLLKKRKS